MSFEQLMTRPVPFDRKNTIVRDMDGGAGPCDSVHAYDIEQRESCCPDELIRLAEERCAEVSRIERLLRDEPVHAIKQGTGTAHDLELCALDVQLAKVDMGYACFGSPIGERFRFDCSLVDKLELSAQ